MAVLTWDSRQVALQACSDELVVEAALIKEGFELLDTEIRMFDAAPLSDFTLVCGVTLHKGRNLVKGVLSLVLDNLGQEAGALARPVLEAHELLAYFRRDPSRVQQALTGKLPSAGKIAERIDGKFQFLRDYLNEHASHFRFTAYSVRGLLNRDTYYLELDPLPRVETLRKNLLSVSTLLLMLVYEGCLCLHTAKLDVADLAIKVDEWRLRVLHETRE